MARRSEGTPVLTVVDADGSTLNGSLIDEIVREGARRILAAVLEAEVDAYIAELANERDERGRRLVVRNGHHQPRKVTDRKSPKIAEVLPLLYLHGLSSGDFVPVMEQFLGGSAGLSPATVTRLTAQWQDDHASFQDRDLSGTDYVYIWVDGIPPAYEQRCWVHKTANVIDSMPKSAQPAAKKALQDIYNAEDTVNGAHLVALVRAGARFERGVLVERPEARAA